MRAIRVPDGGSFGRSRLDTLTGRAKGLGAAGLVWMRVIGGDEGPSIDSPVGKFLSMAEKTAIVRATGAAAGDLLLIVAGERLTTCHTLGQLRLDLGQPPIPERPLRFLWVSDFPMFEGVDAEGHPLAAHHPFTMPHPDDLHLLESEPLSVRSQSYDLVVNGWELGSGSIRIHRADIQRRVFTALGITDEEAESKFGFLLGAFRYGAPPHGGFAFGTDRLTAILAGEDNIREVIAFPKTQSGADLMSGSPKAISASQLKELRIQLLGAESTTAEGAS